MKKLQCQCERHKTNPDKTSERIIRVDIKLQFSQCQYYIFKFQFKSPMWYLVEKQDIRIIIFNIYM